MKNNRNKKINTILESFVIALTLIMSGEIYNFTEYFSNSRVVRILLFLIFILFIISLPKMIIYGINKKIKVHKDE